MTVTVASGGTTSAAGTASQLAFRRCEDGTVYVPNVGTFAPFYTGTVSLPGSVVAHVRASSEKTKSGVVRVLLQVKVSVPVTNTNANGNYTVSSQEITLHCVLAMPANFVNALRGAYAIADTSVASPVDAAKSALVGAISMMVSVLTNQTIDAAALATELTTLPIYQGALGVCPLNEDSGSYGTTWIRPPSAT
jgi:hypothetical protein